MTCYSFPGASLLEQRKYYHKVIKNRRFAYAMRFTRILKAIEKATGATLKDLQSRRRGDPLPFLRALVASELIAPKITYKQIGRDLKRDHTTIMYYIKELLPSCERDDEFIRLKNNIQMYL